MKKNYYIPVTAVQPVSHISVICAGSPGDRVNSNVGIHGGGRSGDVTGAF
jgi:hypothetical protein